MFINDGRDRTVSFTNDMGGQVIRRDESDTITTQGDPHGIWYRFNGRELATTANQPTPTMMTYTESAADRSTTPPSTYTFTAKPTVDSDLSYDQISSFRQGSAGGRYTVRGGETLQTIAQAVWGDASLWYKLAEANGLSGDAMLVEGQQLSLPAGVVRSKNNASTFKPYDAAETLGNTSPTAPKPPKKKGCGMMGQILVAVVAIAVTIILPQLVPFLATPLGMPITAMAANAAAQGTSIALGMQNDFSWKGVAQAGLESVFSFGQSFGAVGAAASNAVAQGIGVLTGLQKKFDWAGVAAAGVSAAVNGAIDLKFGPQLAEAGRAAQAAVHASAAAISNAATRSVINGTSFGDNLIAALPSVIAQTIGGMVADGVAGRRSAGAAAEGISEGVAAGTTGQTQDILGSDPWGILAQTDQIMTAWEADTQVLQTQMAFAALDPSEKARIRELAIGGSMSSAGDTAGPDGQRVAGAGSIPGSSPIGDDGVSFLGHINTIVLDGRSTADLPAYLANMRNTFGESLSRVDFIDQFAYGSDFQLELGLAAFAANPDDLLSSQIASRIRDEMVHRDIAGRTAAADRAAWDVVSAGLNADAPTAAYRMAFGGEVNWSNGVTVVASALGPLAGVFGKVVSKGSAPARQTLYHYTNEAGMLGITESNALNPSLWRVGTKDVYYGNGQYVSDIVPGAKTPAQLSRSFLGHPFQGKRFTHYVEIDATGLGAVQGRTGVFVIPNEVPLDLTGRLLSSGRVPVK